MTTAHAVQSVPLSNLFPSRTTSQAERRHHWDKAALDSLADSLKRVGMLQPIVVRDTNALRGARYEIVAGERRFLAAKKAGLEEVPVAVRELTDEQVIEVQLIENLQREGLHELAEAEGYEQLMKHHAYTVEVLVDKVQRSKAYVYARLKLLALVPEARKAFYAGELNASTALLLARIPVPALQKEALKEITTANWDGSRKSVRWCSDHIEHKYMLRLKEAPFPTGAPDLLPGVGPCGACPKRTGNQPELFGDIKGADVCTDPQCYADKRKAHSSRQIAAAEANGQEVITGKAAAKVFANRWADPVGYVRLDAACEDDPKRRTYQRILGKAVSTVLIRNEHADELVACARADEVAKALKAAGIKRRPATDGNARFRNEQKARQDKAKLERRFRLEVFGQVMAQAPAALAADHLRRAAAGFFRAHHAELQKDLLTHLGLETPKAKHGGYYDQEAGRKSLSTYLEKASDAELAKVVVCLTLLPDLQVSSYLSDQPKALLAEAERLKIDTAGIRKRLQAEKAARKKKAKRKAA